jgi:hypothetical protein
MPREMWINGDSEAMDELKEAFGEENIKLLDN